MSQRNARGARASLPQLTVRVVLLPKSDQRSPLVTTSQLNAILALLVFGQLGGRS